jgi:hypothetical protein
MRFYSIGLGLKLDMGLEKFHQKKANIAIEIKQKWPTNHFPFNPFKNLPMLFF